MASSDLRIATLTAGNGQIGLTLCPGRTIAARTHGPRDLDQDLNVIQAEGYSRAVVLLEQHELDGFAPELMDGYERYGIAALQVPIEDVSVPEERDRFAAVIEEILQWLDQGEKVLLHCRGGLGRTGLVAACILVTLGESANEAINAVREARPGAIETPEQADFVKSFRKQT